MDKRWNANGNCSSIAHGWVTTEQTCYKWVDKHTLQQFNTSEKDEYYRAKEYCKSMGGRLAAPKYDREWHWVIYTYIRSKHQVNSAGTIIGICWGNMSVPNMYRRTAIAGDRTVLYHQVTTTGTLSSGHEECAFVKRRIIIYCRYCHRNLDALCEFQIETNHSKKIKPIPELFIAATSSNFMQEQITQCQDGHMTHLCLSCGPNNVCGKHKTPCFFSKRSSVSHQDPSQRIIFFTCDHTDTALSYSFVCDFRPDCPDQSDESFCEHPLCDAYTCKNGQCVPGSKRCDKIHDCLDDSDETNCEYYRRIAVSSTYLTAPVLVSFDGSKTFILTKMKPGELCPDTHYRCPGDVNDCLPVYTRCNGMYDCVGHEDEAGCEEMTCPGFFRCRLSSVCVHSDHICDGWPHCPLNDDELFCGMICPRTCLCHGHMFLCSQHFSTSLFPQLRYLDGAGSGMTPLDLKNSFYLVHLSLAKCFLNLLPNITLYNLQFLDLSDNNIKHVDMATFVGLRSLRTLSLARNPLDTLSSDPAVVTYQTSLKTLDLSHTKLKVFDSLVISGFMSLRKLNLSFSTIHTIGPNGYKSIPFLTTISMVGVPVKTFPPDIFRGLPHLSSIAAHNFKFCCKDILPGHFKAIFCNAPKNEISSCGDLLRTDSYRVFLWLISCLAVVGNVFCFILRLCTQKTSMTSYSLFVSNLSLSDLLMGIYLSMIGVADEVYRERYLFHDDIWVSSGTCKSAGFLSLLSSEVSAMIIWLISLDRFIVIQFPFGNVRFERNTALMACVVIWSVGVALAMLPLLPLTSHWEFYSQTGICVPLPITRLEFKGYFYSFSVLIVFNFVLFMMISACQAFIFWSIKKHSMVMDATKISRDITIARRLITVAVTDFLCWFPIGLCGILAFTGIPIPGEVNVAFAIFFLPLNSALNPFVYTLNTLIEKRRKANETKLLRWLETHDAMV